jgi:hypothetical protein
MGVLTLLFAMVGSAIGVAGGHYVANLLAGAVKHAALHLSASSIPPSAQDSLN